VDSLRRRRGGGEDRHTYIDSQAAKAGKQRGLVKSRGKTSDSDTTRYIVAKIKLEISAQTHGHCHRLVKSPRKRRFFILHSTARSRSLLDEAFFSSFRYPSVPPSPITVLGISSSVAEGGDNSVAVSIDRILTREKRPDRMV